MLETVSVPPELEPLFHQAQEFVSAYFRTLRADAAHGTISIGGQRYILVRAASMSVEFFATITQLYSDQGQHAARTVARSLLYDLAYAIGAADARAFHRELDVHDPVARLSAGPVHFAYTGWARVRISPESHPTADDAYLLIYEHPYSFEAEAWLATGNTIDFPACVMNAGYSAGWCTASFGLPLVGVEVCCKAMGDDTCRFVMAPPERVEHAVAAYLQERPDLARAPSVYEIPGLFSRKQAEDELRERELQYRSIFESVTDAILIVRLDGRIATANPAAERLYGYTGEMLAEMHHDELTAPDSRRLLDPEHTAPFFAGTVSGEGLALAAGGRVFEVEYRAAAFGYRRQPHILVLITDISERKRAEAERLRLQEQLIRQNERLSEEAAFARTVQQGLLPRRPPWDTSLLAVACRSLAASEVARDFYAYVSLADGRMLVALGDVGGKGVAAALVMALMISAIESQAHITPDPATCLAGLQERLIDQLQACETTVALTLVVIDTRRAILTMASAGMPPLLLLRAGEVRMIEQSGLPLGIVKQGGYQEQHLDLLPGDRLILVSDGVVEARSPYRELFGYDRLLRTLRALPLSQGPDELIDGLLASITAFMGDAERHDDLTTLALAPSVRR